MKQEKEKEVLELDVLEMEVEQEIIEEKPIPKEPSELSKRVIVLLNKSFSELIELAMKNNYKPRIPKLKPVKFKGDNGHYEARLRGYNKRLSNWTKGLAECEMYNLKK